MAALLDDFIDLFSEFTGLPPERPYNHHINLVAWIDVVGLWQCGPTATRNSKMMNRSNSARRCFGKASSTLAHQHSMC